MVEKEKFSKKATWLKFKCKTTISIMVEKSLKKKSFQKKKLDWLKIKKNARQHDNEKKTIMAINTTLSSFLNIEHTREIKDTT